VDIDYEKLSLLQQIDTEIKNISSLLDGVPDQLEGVEQKIAASSNSVAQAKEKLASNQKKRRDLEAQVKDIRAQIGKYKRQLNEVKSNKEYTSLLKEIEEAEHKVDSLEEDIINEMLAADDIELEIKRTGEKHHEEDARLHKEKESIALNKKHWEAKREELNQAREELLPKIPADQANLYHKIFMKKGGFALSPVTDDFCSMCHMRIRPQVLNELRDSQKLFLCENCGRILFMQKKKEAPEAEPPSSRST
jgi:predicted  nucleic acid-binding Zn-ribbon protein